MSALLDQVSSMFEQQLYSSVVQLLDLLLPITATATAAAACSLDPQCVSPGARQQLLAYQAHALCRLHEHRRAEHFCRRALQLTKSLAKARPRSQSGVPSSDSGDSVYGEQQLRLLLHQCLVAQRQLQQAAGVLEAVPARQRSVRVNMALGRVYERLGTERAAVAAYKEVLRQCPLALDAARALLSLGVRGTEVASLMVVTGGAADWLAPWLRVQSHLHAGEFGACAAVVHTVESAMLPLLSTRPIQVAVGTALYCAGDSTGALLALQRAHAQEPYVAAGTDVLAALYHEQERRGELVRLAQLAGQMCGTSYGSGSNAPSPQSWIVLGYHATASRHHVRALYFAHRAVSLAPRCVEGLLLKALLMRRLGQSEQAAVHYREAMQLAPARFEPLSGLVECYVRTGRHKEATSLANGALKQPGGQTPRALTLCARVLSHEPMYASRARSLLERALAMDSGHLAAALLLAQLYEKSGCGESALELLRRQLHANGGACRLQLALAGLLARRGETAAALQHYRAALALQPDNMHALRALARLEADPAAAPQVDDPVSDVESEPGTSEHVTNVSDNELVVSGWADMDFSLGM